MTLKAIETIYNGYRFRSRLEARWAVFFDTLGVPYHYEPEGFDLDGIWYLPDFWLPKQECWVEIKPHYPDENERKKMRRLAVMSGFDVALFDTPDFQAPDRRYGMDFVGAWGGVFQPDFDIDDLTHDGMVAWGMCVSCVSIPEREPRLYMIVHTQSWERHVAHHHPGSSTNCFCDDDSGLVAAYAAARSARFEHGKQP